MLEVDITKHLGSFTLAVELRTDARRVVLFGPSGSGKSLTLQCLAGLLQPDRGALHIDGVTVFDSESNVDLPPQRRSIGYVPQGAPLFPHLSVAQNVTYGLRQMSASERRAEVDRLLELVHLAGYGSRRPTQLSGGEQQRVALARALARHTKLLLLDEPFSALDAPVRAALRGELLELQARIDVSCVFVTHDLEEAYTLAEDVAVYGQGHILQQGNRDAVFLHPATAEVARLVGVRNVLPATVTRPGEVRVDELNLCLLADAADAARESCWACIRAEDVRVLRKDRPTFDLGPGTRFNATVMEERQLGFTVSLGFLVGSGSGDARLWVDLSRQAYQSLGIALDKRWDLFVPAGAIHLIPRGN